MKLEGRVAIITGGGGGMGGAQARLFAREGASVATPLGRLQTPEDIAQAFLFVVSDDAAMVTGSMLTVDGGAGL